MTLPDPKTQAEFAREVVRSHAQDIERMSVGEMMSGDPRFDEVTEEEFDDLEGAIYDQARTLAETLTWSEESQRALNAALTEQAAKDVAALSAAYRERAHLVALLAAVYPSTWTTDPEGTDWHIVYVELPTGQASWHIAPADVDLFPHVSGGDKSASEVWDNHTTDEKYARIRHLTAQTHAANKRGAENAQALEPLLAFGRHIADAARPDPIRDFKAASDRFHQAMTAAAELTTHAGHLAAVDAAIEDYNRAVDAYNADAEQYNRVHGLTEDDDAAETLRYLVHNDDAAALVDVEAETAVHGLLADLGQRARNEKAAG